MFRNFFVIAIRNLVKNKSFSTINILGLAIGMASAVLILLWIQNEVSHDRFHQKIGRLYIANSRDKFNGELWAWSHTSKPLATALKKDYAEVEDAVRVTDAHFLLTKAEKQFTPDGIIADDGFINLFSFPLLAGDRAALGKPGNMIITEQLAIKLFGNNNAIGQVVRVDSADNFIVAAVLKALPNNTRFNFEYILPWTYLTKLDGDDQYWTNNSVKTYVLLKPGVSQTAFDAKIKNIIIDHTGNAEKSTTTIFTQPLAEAWLYSKSINGQYTTGRIEQVWLFGIICGFILLIACINFMNLSTARSEKRAREVGIRKVVGAHKGWLIVQFIGESVLLSLIAGILALVLVQVSLPSFNLLVSKQLFIDYASPLFWLLAVGFVLFTGVLAGSYPAFYLSGYQPVKVLKGSLKVSHSLVSPRKVLVVLQFTFAIVLIICTILVQHQIEYAQQRNAGYNRNNLGYVAMQGAIEKHFDAIKNELLESGAVASVTRSLSPVSQRYSDGWGFSWPGSEGEDSKVDFIRMSTDADFVKTMQVQLTQGRDIDINAYPSDSTAVLLNETAVKVMRLKNPIGQIVKGDGEDWHIVGVLKDFIYESPYQKVNQLLIMGPKSWFRVIHLKLNNSNSDQQNLAKVETIFKKYNPAFPFIYKFIDEEYAAKFESEQRFVTLTALFSGLTIFISCLGLFGLATYMAENRVKEIGVRKVLGASVASITALLSKDFLKLVIIAFVIAAPFAWWAMSNWLQSYDYRITIRWWVFLITAAITFLIALLTVSYQAIKAAIANPVKSLRSE